MLIGINGGYFPAICRVCLLIAVSASHSVIIVLLSFYNSKNLNCIGALSFFIDCSHIFMIFEVKLE